MTDTEAMHEALALAREAADEGEVPVGCIVTDGEHIVGRGRNRRPVRQSPEAFSNNVLLQKITSAARRTGR